MNRNKGIFGLILILLGTLLLMRGLGIFWFSFGSLFRLLLPFGLIAIGISMIMRRRHRELRIHAQTGKTARHPDIVTGSEPPDQVNIIDPAKYSSADSSQPSSNAAEFSESKRFSNSPSGIEGGWVKYSKFLGDTYIDLAGLSLERIDISSFLGDIEIKLIDGKLAEGLNRLVVSGFVGDIRVFLSRDTAYLVQCSNFMGDIKAGSRRASGISNRVDTQSPDYDSAESKLFIAANSFLGDIRIYVM